MFFSAVIGIVAFLLAALPNSPGYYQVPMGITGKVYANSMLVLINNRMLLGSEEIPSSVSSVMKFHTPFTHRKYGAIEVYNGDPSVDNE